MLRDQIVERPAVLVQGFRHVRVDVAGAIKAVQPRHAIQVRLDALQRVAEPGQALGPFTFQYRTHEPPPGLPPERPCTPPCPSARASESAIPSRSPQTRPCRRPA